MQMISDILLFSVLSIQEEVSEVYSIDRVYYKQYGIKESIGKFYEMTMENTMVFLQKNWSVLIFHSHT